jgi:hypothetical protein
MNCSSEVDRDIGSERTDYSELVERPVTIKEPQIDE